MHVKSGTQNNISGHMAFISSQFCTFYLTCHVNLASASAVLLPEHNDLSSLCFIGVCLPLLSPCQGEPPKKESPQISFTSISKKSPLLFIKLKLIMFINHRTCGSSLKERCIFFVCVVLFCFLVRKFTCKEGPFPKSGVMNDV